MTDASLHDVPARIVIATRQSRLALWQAEHVRARLRELYPRCVVELLPLTTRGDQILDRSLAKIGGKGLFVKELETALAEGRADLAVHSAKDVPMSLPEGFALAAILPREDSRDAFVSNRYAALSAMPAGAILGTSSLRREAQVRARYPALSIVPLRGNVETRLAKVDRGECDAALLAVAGLKRLDLSDRIRVALPIDESLPAPGQGALAIEISTSASDLARWLAPLADRSTTACVKAERAVSRALGGSCQLPLAAHATAARDQLHLRGLVAAPDASRMVWAEVSGPIDAAESLGAQLAAELRSRGAAAIIESLADA